MRTLAARFGAGAAAASVALAAAGCGDDGTFTAQDFVTAINAQGVNLELGDPLTTEEEGKELYAIELSPAGGPRRDSQGEEVHAGGSLSVYESDEGEPDEEFSSCQAAADLLCYRAANVVVVLEGGGIEAQQLGVAMQRLRD
jgi:hypothetical protein